jgi:uncharacterized protein (TIGR03435 family)
MSVRRIALLLAAVIAAPIALAQTPQPTPQPAIAPTPKFDVVSVKLDKAAQGWRETITADGYSAKGITLKTLLMHAYGIMPDYRIVGAPGWSNDNRYDIEAKVGDSDVAALQKMERTQRFAMLQQVLTERFNLKAHSEDRIQPIYSLVVAKQGRLVKTPPSADDKNSGGGTRRSGSGQFTLKASNYSMASLVAQLRGIVGRMVVDNTGLTGGYDVKLDWTLDDSVPTSVSAKASGSSAPSIFTALEEQLGLKLVPTKGPVEVLVVDHVDTPSEN